MPDLRVLNTLADEMDVRLGLPHVAAVRTEIEQLGRSASPRSADPATPAVAVRSPRRG